MSRSFAAMIEEAEETKRKTERTFQYGCMADGNTAEEALKENTVMEEFYD